MATNQGSGWRLAEAAGTGIGGFLGGPLGAALIGGATTLVGNLWSARRADTAHQREVRDLRAAGINPILTGRGPGAPVGELQDVGRGAASAMEVARARAEINLLEAQARREGSTARLAETQANEISSFAPGRAAEVSARQRLLGADADVRSAQLENLRELARSEIQRNMSSAEAAKAVAALNRLDVTRAENIAEFEKMLGASSPAVRLFLEVLRSLSTVRR